MIPLLAPSVFECVNAAPPCRYREQTQGFTGCDWLGWFLPCVVWLREYKKSWLMVRARSSVTYDQRRSPASLAAEELACLHRLYVERHCGWTFGGRHGHPSGHGLCQAGGFAPA